jgi:hypothetical protein
MAQSPAEQMKFSKPYVSQYPWFVALLLGTVATPGGVIFAWLAPRPLDAVLALPLVLVDVWASGWATGTAETTSKQAPIVRLLLLVLGIVLTWVFYVLVARLLLWRVLLREPDEVESG